MPITNQYNKNCKGKRHLVGPTCLDKCSGNAKPARTCRPHKGLLTIACPRVLKGNGKWFTQMKSVNYFTLHEDYFLWSTENNFKLTNILRRTKHSKIKKNIFQKTFYAETYRTKRANKHLSLAKPTSKQLSFLSQDA